MIVLDTHIMCGRLPTIKLVKLVPRLISGGWLNPYRTASDKKQPSLKIDRLVWQSVLVRLSTLNIVSSKMDFMSSTFEEIF
jgi:hypothetical protein